MEQVSLLSKAFALSVPSKKAMEIKEELGFFQAIRACLSKFKRKKDGKSDAEIETAIRQIVDKAIDVGDVVDIFCCAGIKKPKISFYLMNS